VLQCVAVFYGVLQYVAVSSVECIALFGEAASPAHPEGAVQCGAVCCSVLQCVAACCSLLQFVAVCCCILQCVVVCSSVLECVTHNIPRCLVKLQALCILEVQCIAGWCSVLQCAAACCRMFAVRFIALQSIAVAAQNSPRWHNF